LRSAVTCLPDRLRTVVEGLFLEERSVAHLAEELGVTQSRISQMRTEALGLLRDGMNHGLDPDLLSDPEQEGVAERRRQSYFAAVAARAAGQPTLTTVPQQRVSASRQRAAVAAYGAQRASA